MTISDLFTEAQKESERRSYMTRFELLDQTVNILKARLYITLELFIQIYQNDQFSSISMSLIQNGARIYARDKLREKWHRHNKKIPEYHDTSPEGQKVVGLDQFLDEVETVLAELSLP